MLIVFVVLMNKMFFSMFCFEPVNAKNGKKPRVRSGPLEIHAKILKNFFMN